ncbi:unnamed protein product [Paramecium pentaurelia]|uniref:Cilia- and flagella-associated protein 43 n=1 Tax=Paramecium pentaurelia TaxID=43138 RepID=A0A8S1U5N7_9CILI|nr:unnamed protein product [Paramecium pentaurelia]
MNVYDCIAFTGDKWELLEQDTIGFLAGNTLCKWNLENNSKTFVHSQRQGFQCFTVHYRKNILVVAEYGLNPIVHVYDNENEYDLVGVSPLEILQMEVSYCGRYLLVILGVPKFEICLWDLREKCRVKGKFSQLPLKLNFIEAKFTILNERILIRYANELQLYQITPHYDNQIQKQVQLELVASIELSAPTIMVQDYNLIDDSKNQFEQNNIYLIQGNVLIYLDGTNLTEIVRHECHSEIKHLIPTQVHLIVVYAHSKIEWLYKYITNNLHDKVAVPFKVNKKYNFHDRIEVKKIMYNQQCTKLICSQDNATLFIIPVPAEGQLGEDEAQVDQQEEDKIIDLTHEIEPVKLGPFQKGVITFIREYKQHNVIVCGSDQGIVLFMDVITKQPLSSFNMEGKIYSGELIEPNLIIGTSAGVLRFYNVADIRQPVLFKMIKLYIDKPITSISINDNNLAVCSIDSPTIFFFQNENLIGFVDLPFNCQAIAYGKGQLFCICSFLLLSIPQPKQSQSLKLEVQIMGRKIDPDQTLLIVTPQQEVITTGKDKIFKKYKFPEELLSKMDLKMRVANQPPVDEQDGHQLPATCLAIKDFLYSSAKDGTIMFRSYQQLNQDVRLLRGHNLKSGGVSTIFVSQKYKMIYSGGFEGDLFWWTGEKIRGDSDAAQLMKNNYNAPMEIQDMPDQEVRYYQQVLEIEFLEQQAPIREQQKRQTKDLLKQIQSKLNALLQENAEADELERLSRDEFVIDLYARDAILEDGKKQQQALRDLVKKENVRQEILYQLIKERTWDQMEIPLKGVNGLIQHIIVTNYHIRVRQPEEMRKLKLIRELRKQEIRELKIRKQQAIKEVWSIEEHIQDPKYIINSKPGIQTMVLNDYEKKEEVAPTKAAAKPGVGGVQQKQPPGRAQAGAASIKARQQQQQQQQQQEEEKRQEEEKQKELEKQQQQQKATEEKKEGSEDLTEWDYLYGISELFTLNRKRNQMILINDVIFSMKRQFNAEFELIQKQRQQQLDNINERNKRIIEINGELKRDPQLQQMKKNILEDPEKILTVKPEEIGFSQYETREMREKKEQERLKEEARMKALMADDSGIRAVKDMMGGTLEEKKETPLDEKLEVEEWMKKSPDDMTEEERMKLKEFEVRKQKLEEEKEKIRKNLEAELKKLNNEITDICQRFDDKLLILFRRKLEYDYRILEQELSIVRLALSIIISQQAQLRVSELEKLHDEMTTQLNQLQQMKTNLDQTRDLTQQQRKTLNDQIVNYFNRGQTAGMDANKVKILWQYAFEDQKTNERAKQESDEKLLKIQKYKDILIQIDPLFENQKKIISAQLDEQFETYLFDIQEKASNLQGIDFEHVRDQLLQVLGQRFKMKLESEKVEKDFNDLENFNKKFEQDFNQLSSQLTNSEEDIQSLHNMLEKSRSNIEVMFRFKQGYVEISQDKPVPNLQDAALIPRETIEKKNDEIKKEGDTKIELMKDIIKSKYQVEKNEYDLKKRDLIIQDLECKTREVQLLKVKKEMQIALTKDDTRLNERELANLKDQIDLLKSATDKRLQIINKKREKIEKDIDFIKKENQQLIAQGGVLSGNVKQLQDISDMQNKKNVRQGEEQQEPQEDKFTQIARNYRLFKKAKEQAEEIEILRDELTKLKAKTFANFQQVHR